MKKTTKIMIAILIAAAVIAIIVYVIMINTKTNKNISSIKVESADDLVKLIDEVYKGQSEESLPMSLQTQTIDVSDETMVKSFTGLDNGNDLEYLVVSEPMMTSRAYSFVIAKVKNGADANKIAEEMKDKVDSRKWICVSAEKIYTTSSDNIVCLVMSDEETAKPIYNKFKDIVKNVGQEYEKSEEIELPPEMY